MSEPQYQPVPIDDLADDLETIRQAKAKAKEWTLLADVLMALVKERIGPAAEATVSGRPVVRRSERQVTRLDTKTLRAEVPADVLAPYLTTTTEVRYEMVNP